MCLSMPHWQHVYNMLAITLIILHLFYALPIATVLSTCISLHVYVHKILHTQSNFKKNPLIIIIILLIIFSWMVTLITLTDEPK